MRGRRPAGPELAERLDGSPAACRRMRVILETIAGTRRVGEACTQLGICEQRFEALRATAIRAGIAALEGRPIGRPRKVPSGVRAEVTRLEERVADLEAELRLAAVRLELAAVLGRPGGEPGKSSPRSGRAKGPARSRSRPGDVPGR